MSTQTPPPYKRPTGLFVAVAVIALAVGYLLANVANKGTSQATPSPQTITSTVTEPGSVIYLTQTPSSSAPVVTTTNVDARACGLLHEAQTFPVYSSRWDGVMYKAESAAQSTALYRLVYKAENEVFGSGYTYEADAKADVVQAIKEFC